MQTLFLSILAGLSTFSVALLQYKFNIFSLNLLPVTSEKLNVILGCTFGNLILCKISWLLNVSNIFTSPSQWLIFFVLGFMCLVVSVKYLYIIVASFPSSVPISFSSISKMLFKFKPLFEKNGLTDFENVLLSVTLLTLRLWI